MDSSIKNTNIIQDQAQYRKTDQQTPKPKTKTFRDMRWEEFKDEIHHLYIIQNKPLSETILVMENRHGFAPSVRAWKTKLREWKFDKYLPAKVMKILLAIREKRMREDGKETVFRHGSSTIASERFENFKKRNFTSEEEDSYPSIRTPENVTYCTPKPEGVASSYQDYESSQNNILDEEMDTLSPGLTMKYLRLANDVGEQDEVEEWMPKLPAFSSPKTSEMNEESVNIMLNRTNLDEEFRNYMYEQENQNDRYEEHTYPALLTIPEEEMGDDVATTRSSNREVSGSYGYLFMFHNSLIKPEDIPNMSNARSHKSGTTISGSTPSHKYGLTYSDGSNMSVMDFNYSDIFS